MCAQEGVIERPSINDEQVRDLMALSPDSLHKKGGRLQPCILPRG